MPLALFKATLNIPAWSGAIEAVWFKRLNHRYDVFQKLKSDLKPGADLWIVGRTEPSLLPAKEIKVDEYYRLDDPRAGWHVGRIVPVYAATEGVSQKLLRELVVQALPAAEQIHDILPSSLLQKRELLAAAQAVQGIHFPKSFAELEEARRRLAYEELLLLNLAWILKRQQTRAISKSYGYEIRKNLLTPFRRQLGFELTGAQRRVINEIFTDMQASCPMTRLLQGDVGSGKTVVAIAALLLAVENGYQGAFMAPTEILAEQHYLTMSSFLRGLPVRTILLTSRVPPKERAKALEALAQGQADIVIGTHALLEEDVRFRNLRLTIIDEQHRFGVRQRATLRRKGPPLDLLVMTATPIPRTLALAMYGDLSVSTVDEMPPGRAPISTHHGSEAEALAAVRAEASAGRQAYVVYPIISESTRLDLKAAKAEFERLKNGELNGLRVALIHGQMRGNHKVQAMESFARGETQVLVATQVVEVGVDVPNATVMVIQNADRFGLASLHQLRGRVGRGGHSSQCWLVGEPQTPEAQQRIQILCESSDGFRIGEEDLKIRGPGDVLGTLQHGELSLRVADLFKDADLQAQARADAEELLERDPSLSLADHKALRERFLNLYQRQWHAVDLA
jgi:ATP-dependent DNA helicase RecG